MKFKNCMFILLAAAFVSGAFAEITTPRIFSDSMVFQRGAKARIWGTAEPKAKVEVKFDGQTKSAVARKDGKWVALLDPMKANKTPQDVRIFENGKLGKTIKDVLVGEVWILAGQSNMEGNMGWIMRNNEAYQKAMARADYPNMRFFRLPGYLISETEQSDLPASAKWEHCNKQSLNPFSATGFFAGEQIMKALDVPVAMIYTPFGGSTMRAWIPQSANKNVPYWQKMYEDFVQKKAAYDYEGEIKKYNAKLAEYNESVKKAKAEGKPAPEMSNYLRWDKPDKITPLNCRRTPNYFFNAKIAPIAGYTAKGVMWYQGESDDANESLACFDTQYVELMKAWRQYWKKPNLYCVEVQLPSFRVKSWPDLRLKQQKGAEALKKNSVMVCIIDTGEENDVHPADKDIVGERIAKAVLNKVYKQKIVGFGPSPKSVKYEGDKAVVQMDLHGSKSLKHEGESKGFEVKVGGKWVPANAVVKGKMLIIRAADKSVKGDIAGVRYLHTPWAKPLVWLYNQDGLPAIPFMNEK